VACPIRTYNEFRRKWNISQCEPCNRNTYNDKIGQPACNPCSTSAISEPNSTECICLGKHRAFQASLGSCICEPGFESYMDGGVLAEETANSEVDCQPKTYANCPAGQTLGAGGDCTVFDNSILDAQGCNVCMVKCAGAEEADVTTGKTKACTDFASAKFSTSLGVCECDGGASLDDICDAACQNQAPKVTVTAAGIKIGNRTERLQDLPGLVGDIACNNPEGCDVITMKVTAKAIQGIYGVSAGITEAFDAPLNQRRRRRQRQRRRLLSSSSSNVLYDNKEYNKEYTVHKEQKEQKEQKEHNVHKERKEQEEDIDWANAKTQPADADAEYEYLHSDRRRRRLLVNAVPAITQPLICIQENTAFLFDLAVDPTVSNKTSYPVYVRDSLLNTNLNFAYGPFLNLATLDKEKKLPSLFGFTFKEAGKYVFANSNDKNLQTVVAVMPAGGKCPTGGPIVPLTESALLKTGVKIKTDGIVRKPNWTLIGCLFAGLGVVLFVVIGGLFAFRGYAIRQQEKKLHMHRRGARMTHVSKARKGGAGLASPRSLPAAGGGDDDEWEEVGEGATMADLRGLLEEVESHSRDSKDAFQAYRTDNRILLTALQDEARQLKRMITSRTKLMNSGIEKAQSLIKLLLGELAARDLFDHRSGDLENGALESLQEAQASIDEGPDTVAGGLVQELTDIIAYMGHGAEALAAASTWDEDSEENKYYDETKAGEAATGTQLAMPGMHSLTSGKVIRQKVAAAGRMFRRVLAAYEAEYERRRRSITTWNMAVEAGSTELGETVLHELERLRDLDMAAEEECKRLTTTLSAFAAGGDEFNMALHNKEKEFMNQLASVRENQQVGTSTEGDVKSFYRDELRALFNQLVKAVSTLGLRAHQVKLAADGARKACGGQREVVRAAIAGRKREVMSEMEELVARGQGAAAAAAAAGIHGGELGDEEGDPFAAVEGHGDEMLPTTGSAAEEAAVQKALAILRKEQEEEAAKLSKELKQAESAKMAELNAKMKEQDKAVADTEDEADRAAVAATVAEMEASGASEEEVAEAVKALREQQDRVKAMIAADRVRHQEDLRNRLLERTAHKKERMEVAQEKERVAAERKAKQDAELSTLDRAHEATADSHDAALDAEAEAQIARQKEAQEAAAAAAAAEEAERQGKKARLAKELARAKTQDDVDRIRGEMEADKGALQEQLHAERDHKQGALKDRLARRRAKQQEKARSLGDGAVKDFIEGEASLEAAVEAAAQATADAHIAALETEQAARLQDDIAKAIGEGGDSGEVAARIKAIKEASMASHGAEMDAFLGKLHDEHDAKHAALLAQLARRRRDRAAGVGADGFSINDGVAVALAQEEMKMRSDAAAEAAAAATEMESCKAKRARRDAQAMQSLVGVDKAVVGETLLAMQAHNEAVKASMLRQSADANTRLKDRLQQRAARVAAAAAAATAAIAAANGDVDGDPAATAAIAEERALSALDTDELLHAVTAQEAAKARGLQARLLNQHNQQIMDGAGNPEDLARMRGELDADMERMSDALKKQRDQQRDQMRERMDERRKRRAGRGAKHDDPEAAMEDALDDLCDAEDHLAMEAALKVRVSFIRSLQTHTHTHTHHMYLLNLTYHL
jgi:hypothetical protein